MFFCTLLLISSLWAQKQKTYTFDGFFNGANLKVQCRTSLTTPWSICECMDSLLVNGKNYKDILYGGYEIDIANKTTLGMYDSVHIDMYVKGCELRILNPTDFYPKEILPVAVVMLSEDGTISWSVQQNYPDLKIWVQIEQYKWNEWVRVGPIFTITDEVTYKTNISKYLVKGENKFRAAVASIAHVHIPSDELVMQHKGKKIKYKYKKKEKKIFFNRPTHFELWNEDWLLSAKGEDTVVEMKYQRPGIYYLRYGNTEKKIKVK